MLVTSLVVDDFRNFENLNISFDSNLNIFNGVNGSGKTNLLESLFVVLLGKSQRGATDSVILRENAEYYRLEAKVRLDDRTEESAVSHQRGGRKKITIDKVTVRASELFRHYCAVATSPEDIEILSGSPSKRRNFIDIYLSQASQKYLADLTDYYKVLAQKNAFLKQDNNSEDTPYDDLLIHYGSRIMQFRIEFIRSTAPAVREIYDKISQGHEIGMTYIPSVPLEEETAELDKIVEQFRRRLKEVRQRERIMQNAMTGPHRDDIDFTIRNLPARSCGSQGELRTAAVSLKVAVYRHLKKVRKVTPILMMDEIFAELDENRREMLVALFEDAGQVFITTASAIPDYLEKQGRRFLIERGEIIDG